MSKGVEVAKRDLRRDLIRLATVLAAALTVVAGLTLFGPAQAQAAGPAPIPPGRNVRDLPTRHLVCALSFDDWYDPRYLKSILATLKAAGVTATFFPTGACVDADPALARSIVAAGCTIGNHSYSHPLLTSLTSEQIVSQIQRTEEASAQAGLPDPAPLFRVPYGSWNGKVSRALKQEGYVDVLWNASDDDAVGKVRSPSSAVELAMLGVKPGAIILLHASKAASAECLPELIRRIRADGYRIVDLAEALFPPEQRMPRYQDSSPLLAYKGDWVKAASPSEAGGSLRRASTPGSAVTASFTGITFEWLALTGPDCGKALVIVDGVPKRIVDLYSPSYLHRRTVFSLTGLDDSTHSVTIFCTGSKNAASTGSHIDIDAVRVSGALVQAPPARLVGGSTG